MNVILPPTSPQYLTEQLFVNYGFFTGSATNFQIQSAFIIAENTVATAVGTFLAPTTFTGTYGFLGYDTIYELPVGRVNSINNVVLYEKYNNGVERAYSGTAYLVDPENGFFYIQMSDLDNSACEGCGGTSLGIYKFEVSVTAGYATGTINTRQAELALCMAADIFMKLMYDEGIGVQYENLTKTLQVGRVIQTFEHKGFLGNTPFGPSARAHMIMNLLRPYTITKAGKLGR